MIGVFCCGVGCWLFDCLVVGLVWLVCVCDVCMVYVLMLEWCDCVGVLLVGGFLCVCV